ncbi:polynucleotide adenylyltransferase PcnB [Nevskia sp.]|uniref:polynucleotide adenylyltransferase PcnB n=1 Tax=Nevskia sp. TaxID=1929292 RepID=UPI0025CCA8D2|nr:polynucleotide adenylyltransferase PcnB [Nevskia sp.]
MTEPNRTPREQHPISRANISQGALKVLYGLKDAGYEAYMVGGGVRDLLAGIEPKDFDIATSAHPDQIKRVFRSCRLIGRRFMIAHVRAGEEILEVTTFRGPITDSHERDETGRILSDNVYGTLEEDAFRRDFTVNALYYDIRDFSIVDFCGGIEDLNARRLRLIGDPELRYREDPVRMLRAVRIANKLGFGIDPESAEPLNRLASLLREIPPARLFDEILKLFLNKDALANFDGLRKHGLFAELFPGTERAISAAKRDLELLRIALANTADRIKRDLPVTPAFLYAALLWPQYADRTYELEVERGHDPQTAQTQAADEVLAKQQHRIAIPKRFSLPMREIWAVQPRFEDLRPGRAKRLLTHPRFRAAYDFLLLRAQAGEPGCAALADWWTKAQIGVSLPAPIDGEGSDDSAETDAAGDPAGEGAAKKRRRRGGRNRRKG